MKTFFAKYWPTLVTAGGGVAAFLSPSVQAWAGQHAAYSVPVLTVWGIVLHWLQSPRTN